MKEIDISHCITEFRQVFERESRIIFSAKFGDGKSYFMKKFIESFPQKDNEYYFITLHPVNYVVEDNKDIIEYIKRDILFQLIKDGWVFDYKDDTDKIFDAVCNRESLKKLMGFVSSIVPVLGLKDSLDAINGLLSSISTIKEKCKEQNVLYVADDYLNGFYGKSGSISECDAFTCLIQKSLEHKRAKSVLVIEDLDRIDPAHLFRIMNVLSSQVDNPYYLGNPNGNKFGFDKVILVMDYDIARHIFHHFYGNKANYEGYMNKFLNSIPFHFSIIKEAHKQVEDKLVSIVEFSEVMNFRAAIPPNAVDSNIFYLNDSICSMSVRRCKEFIDDDIVSHIKRQWRNANIKIPTQIEIVKFLYCFRYFTTLPMGTVYDMLINHLRGQLALKLYLPLFAQATKRTYFFVYVGKQLFVCHYDSEANETVVEETNGGDEDLMVDFEKIQMVARRMKDDIIDLLIG